MINANNSKKLNKKVAYFYSTGHLFFIIFFFETLVLRCVKNHGTKQNKQKLLFFFFSWK